MTPGIGNLGPTGSIVGDRQKLALVREGLEPFRHDWQAFTAKHFGSTHDQWQKEALWAINYRQKVAIAGAQSVGKDYVAADAAAAHLILNPFSKTAVTSASRETLFANFWGELMARYQASDLFQKFFEAQTRRIIARGENMAEQWFLLARTSDAHYSEGGGEKTAEGIAGMYAPGGTLVIGDEASGIDDAVLDAIFGTANAPDRKVFLIGNPLRLRCRFADVFRKPAFRVGWVHFHVSFEQSSQTNTPAARALRAQWIRQYGRKSAYVMARVFGRFPTVGGVDILIPEDLAALAMATDGADDPTLPLDIGADMALWGDDLTVVICRRGKLALSLDDYGKKDGVFTVGKIKERIREHLGIPDGADIPEEAKQSLIRIRVDEGGGYGSGVVGPLRAEGFRVAGVQNGGKASTEKMRKKYANIATELWAEDTVGALREGAQLKRIARAGVYDVLFSQLTTRSYDYTTGESKMKLISKEEMRRKQQGSPDYADALVLAYAQARKLKFHGGGLRGLIRLV